MNFIEWENRIGISDEDDDEEDDKEDLGSEE